MTHELQLRCRCGAVRGALRGVSLENCNRVVCYCDDCQCYAHYLGRTDLLDARGGTRVLQLIPAQLTSQQGAEHVHAVRLSEKGLVRWYARCCATPLGNTFASASIPFLAVLEAFVEDTPTQSPAVALGESFSIFGRFARGGPLRGAPAKIPLWLLFQSLFRAVRALFARRHEVPLFRAGELSVVPTVLTPAQRKALEQARVLGTQSSTQSAHAS